MTAHGASLRARIVARMTAVVDDLVDDGAGAPEDRRFVVSLPDRLLAATVLVFLSCAVLAMFGVLFWWTALPVVLASLIGSWWLGPSPTARVPGALLGTILALAGAAVWVAIQIPLASEYFVAIRDPGVYLLSGGAIAATGGSPLDVDVPAQLAAVIPGLDARATTFPASADNTLRTQGSIGLPAVIALGYLAGGVDGAVMVNVIAGGIGLLALYAAARRIVGPRWALVAPALLGAVMPYVYLSRTTYTEILTMSFLLAAGTWTLAAFRSGRIRDAVVAGVFAGSVGLSRIDGALGAVGILLGLVLVLIGVGRSRSTVLLRGIAIAMVVPMIALLALGALDLVLNVPGYFGAQLGNARPLWLAAAVLAAAVVGLALLPPGRRAIEYGSRVTRTIAVASTVALGALLVGWASRPFWLEMHQIKKRPYQNAVEGLQLRDGLPIDPSRSYDEYSLWWFGWYFGWVFLALAAVGLCLWLYWAVSRRRAAHIVLLATAAVSALLYLTFIQVTPDQIWAFRRVLAVITPALVISAVMAARAVWRNLPGGRAVGVVAAVLTVAGIASTWGQIFFAVEGSGQRREIAAICDAADGAAVIALVDPGAPPNYTLTTSSVCGIPTVRVVDPAVVDWSGLAAEAPGRVAVVAFDPLAVPWAAEPGDPLITTTVHYWQRHLLQAPRTTTLEVRSVHVGTLQADGTVLPHG